MTRKFIDGITIFCLIEKEKKNPGAFNFYKIMVTLTVWIRR